MMFYQLADHASYALFEDLAIFLDLRSDRYVALAAAPDSCLRAALEGRSAGFDAPELAGLRNQGLLIARNIEAAPMSAASAIIPARSALETGSARPALDPTTAPEAALCLARAAWWMRTRTLAATIGALRSIKSVTSKRVCRVQDPEDSARAFVAHRRLLPGRPVCLRDSVALMLFMLRRGHRVDLVFGVQAQPFFAHCWIQTEAAILNDSVFGPSSLTPILRL